MTDFFRDFGKFRFESRADKHPYTALIAGFEGVCTLLYPQFPGCFPIVQRSDNYSQNASPVNLPPRNNAVTSRIRSRDC